MRIVLFGFGVVGRSFVELLEEKAGMLYREFGLTPRLVGVADRGGAAVSEHGLSPSELLATKNEHGTVASVPEHGTDGLGAEDLIADSDADIVIEATPTCVDDPSDAMSAMKCAFRHGNHVVTVNKGPLAVAMPALMELAEYNKVQFRFSGTVGGGTPMLTTAKNAATGDEVVRIRGILNGTTNFILSRMHDAGADFQSVLAEAVGLGYAETDPSADIDGIDAATKVVIIANYIFNRRATLSDVSIEGIRDLPRARIDEAAAKGERVKLIGEIGDELSVRPQTVTAGDALDVDANLNALQITLESSGDITLIGRGAGGPETATAILRDVLDIWRTDREHA